jgi:hypothetical protein
VCGTQMSVQARMMTTAEVFDDADPAAIPGFCG